ncbi:unnamed protein product [Echinostoma caproni]|uniref:Transmembrane protein n=1 Tax=Echinostoma caproni TaxID=27848 RepID=A0A183AP02_9TREM|nr:unnamed protein product [Echinostoma caproni]
MNRAVAFGDHSRKMATWYSLDWYSVSDAFQLSGGSSLNPRNHFHLAPILFSVCYLHNWLAYLSRLELYGSCLGYSRPLNAGALNSMASTCLTPASLGCGQCVAFDAWPLWLLWRLSRVLCRFVAFCFARRVYSGGSVGESVVDSIARVRFPFSDLDEI